MTASALGKSSKQTEQETVLLLFSSLLGPVWGKTTKTLQACLLDVQISSIVVQAWVDTYNPCTATYWTTLWHVVTSLRCPPRCTLAEQATPYHHIPQIGRAKPVEGNTLAERLSPAGAAAAAWSAPPECSFLAASSSFHSASSRTSAARVSLIPRRPPTSVMRLRLSCSTECVSSSTRMFSSGTPLRSCACAWRRLLLLSAVSFGDSQPNVCTTAAALESVFTAQNTSFISSQSSFQEWPSTGQNSRSYRVYQSLVSKLTLLSFFLLPVLGEGAASVDCAAGKML